MTLGWEMIAMSDWEVVETGKLKALDEKDMEIQRLKMFEAFVWDIYDDWPDCGTLDGFDLQELGEKHGVLIPEKRTTLCHPECNCSEYYSSADIEAGFTCYRPAWCNT